MPDPITATVGEPTPVPKFIESYGIQIPGKSSLWYASDSRSWVEEQMKLHPGSRLVVIPGEYVCLSSAGGEAIAVARKEASSAMSERELMLIEALRNLLMYCEKNTCIHEETVRLGSNWTKCSMCGTLWADDRGGMPEWKEPQEWTEASKALDNCRNIK